MPGAPISAVRVSPGGSVTPDVLAPKHCESVRDVPVLLDVGDVEVNRVAELDALEVVGREVAADRDHLHVDALAVARDAARRLRRRDVRVRVLGQLVELELISA